MSQEILPQETGELDIPSNEEIAGEQESSVIGQPVAVPQSVAATPPRPRRWLRGIGLIMVVAALLTAFYLIVAYFGWQSGQTQLEEMQTAALQAEFDKQIELAQVDVVDGRYALANERMNWVLQRQPENSQAQSIRQQAEDGIGAILTPQPTATATPTQTPPPTPTLSPSPTPFIIEEPSEEFARIEDLVDEGEWEDAISAITNFQLQFPNYEREQTNRWLYDSNIEHGLSLVEGEQVELGMYFFGQARRLGDLPTEVEDYETWAELYLQGIAFYGNNWGASAYYFRDLCLAAPFYQNSCDKLFEVLEAYGDQYAFVEDWCPAEELYREARSYQRTQAVIQKLEEAGEGCLGATPTPLAPITNTVPITQSQPLIVTPFVTPTPDS